MQPEPQIAHALLPTATVDERARQDFVKTLKLHLARKVAPEIKRIYEQRGEPEFRQREGRAPADRTDVATVMQDDPYYRMWGSMQRCSQELLWSSVAEPVQRQLRDLAAKAAGVENPIGSLQLDPSLPVPRYLSAVDIHCMPGSYGLERFEGDVGQGAMYDRGVWVYAMGGFGPKTDAMGRLTAAQLKDRFPDLHPRRILEVGCGVGHSLLPYAEAFPEAEIHGIDVCAPLLRYGHARAESMGKAVHFKQMDAERLGYPDGYFDLVVSHILFHETSGAAIGPIVAESRRVTRKGGMVAHMEMCQYDQLSAFDGFMLMWDMRHNNEPFWHSYRRMDVENLFTGAGFEKDKLWTGMISRNYAGQVTFSAGRNDAGRGSWQVMGAVA